MPNKSRKILRLPHYDYAQTGAYFITIVTNKRACLFGKIINGEMMLNDAGQMIDSVCLEFPQFIPTVTMEPYVIMPNHFHAIVVIGNDSIRADLRGCAKNLDGCIKGKPKVVAITKDNIGRPRRVAPTNENENITSRVSLSNVVGRYKSLTTRRYIDGVENHNWPRFETRLWQRSYYEHVIRDERDYESIVNYILTNPENWEKDEEYIK